MNRVNPSCFGVSMLRGMNNGVLDPELFDAIDNDTYPDFTKGFDEGKRTNVVDGDVFEYLRERAELTPLPCRKRGSLLPENDEMIIESA